MASSSSRTECNTWELAGLHGSARARSAQRVEQRVACNPRRPAAPDDAAGRPPQAALLRTPTSAGARPRCPMCPDRSNRAPWKKRRPDPMALVKNDPNNAEAQALLGSVYALQIARSPMKGILLDRGPRVPSTAPPRQTPATRASCSCKVSVRSIRRRSLAAGWARPNGSCAAALSCSRARRQTSRGRTGDASTSTCRSGKRSSRSAIGPVPALNTTRRSPSLQAPAGAGHVVARA